jgi:transketolase
VGLAHARPPEYGLTPGVEATTGPLGQGFATRRHGDRGAAARREFNRAGPRIVDHRTYVDRSDGDLQEGVASEAAIARRPPRLGKLIVLYDDNHIQLDGPTTMAWSEDVARRFEAYGWHGRVEDGNDLEAIDAAIRGARTTSGRRSSPSGRTSATAARNSRTRRRPTARRSARTRSA